MSKARKTANMAEMIFRANKVLAGDYSPADYSATQLTKAEAKTSRDAAAQCYRLGIASMLEFMLHATGNYRGYIYLDSPYVEGVTDTSRRHYIVSDALRAEVVALEGAA